MTWEPLDSPVEEENLPYKLSADIHACIGAHLLTHVYVCIHNKNIMEKETSSPTPLQF